MKHTHMATLVAVLMTAAFLVPGGTATPEALPTKEVSIHAEADILDEIVASPGFKATYVWKEIGWIGGTIDMVRYTELTLRPDVFVEDAVYWQTQCHAGNHGGSSCDDGGDGGGGTDTRVPDQTPYGIEQIYGDTTITATSGGAGVVLGHIDTGIDQDHVDLVNRIVYSDADDKNGHGTHTAGTAAADAGSDNLGIYGVAPESSIRSYKVCNMFCSSTDINAAIQDCTGKCDVITFSIGGDSKTQSTADAIQAFVDGGGIFIAAAGNDGSSIGSIDYPGALTTTVGVAAIDSSKTVADFSSRGSNDGDCSFTEEGDVELAAAGVNVLSTYSGGGYDTLSGTSMATPHVAGLALKKWTGDGASTRDALHQGVEDITKGLHAGNGCDPASGAGLPHV